MSGKYCGCIQDWAGGSENPVVRTGHYKLEEVPVRPVGTTVWNTILTQDQKAKKTGVEKLGLTFAKNIDVSSDTAKVNKVCVPAAKDLFGGAKGDKCSKRIKCDPDASVVRRLGAMSRDDLIKQQKEARGYKNKYVPPKGVPEEDPVDDKDEDKGGAAPEDDKAKPNKEDKAEPTTDKAEPKAAEQKTEVPTKAPNKVADWFKNTFQIKKAHAAAPGVHSGPPPEEAAEVHAVAPGVHAEAPRVHSGPPPEKEMLFPTGRWRKVRFVMGPRHASRGRGNNRMLTAHVTFGPAITWHN